MFILKDKTQLENAIAKARKIKPRVRMIAFGVYAVKGLNGDYTVKCERTAHGEKQVLCDCKGGASGLVCYHSTAALELHSTIAKHRQMATV
jgi:3-keto-L-gulonate-6-phosphate decarboxylase